MRIGLVMPGFSADQDDWCIPALRDLVQYLAKTDEVSVLALRYPYRAAHYDVFGAQVTALGGRQRQGRQSAGLWRRALGNLVGEHRRRRFDVLHAFWANETGAITALAGRLLGVPTIVSLAGGELVGFPDIGYGGQLTRSDRWKTAVALRLARAVTAGSRYQLALVSPAAQHCAAGSTQRVPLGVDLDLFQPARSPRADRHARLIQVASLVSVKDQVTLLHAAAELTKRDAAFSLEIVGEGPLRPNLGALAEQLGLTDRVRFRGSVAHHELPEFYRQAGIFVLSSRHEAQCMALLEAAACGLAIVGTRVGVLPELEPEAVVGVAPGEPTALAEAIAALLDDQGGCSAIGHAARARVEHEYGLSRCAGRFRQIYANLAGS